MEYNGFGPTLKVFSGVVLKEPLARFERAAYRVETGRSNPLSYRGLVDGERLELPTSEM